jgi:predicted RNA methylase
MNLAFEGFGIDERIAEERSQWFTPPDLAWRMVRWAARSFPHVLEPSAGSGNLVHAARVVRGADGMEQPSKSVVHAYELDPYYLDRLAERFQGDVNEEQVRLYRGSYLDSDERPDLGCNFDIGIANPPFEDGLDGHFIAKMMNECDRIVVLARTCVLNGADRHERVWSRCGDGGDWSVRGVAFLPKRPVFQAGRAIGDRVDGGGAKADFCVIKMSRRELSEGETRLEWWV